TLTSYPFPLHSFPTRRSSDLHLLVIHVHLIPISARCAVHPGTPYRICCCCNQVPANSRNKRTEICPGAADSAERPQRMPYRSRRSEDTRLNSSHVSISYAVFC